ncbi:FUSC family protein [Tomitella fengzijianii]|nr:FUSC family protein [Tomitella fengzijianii]
MALDLRRSLARQRNVVRGSDPGYGRLRQAAAGAGAMATALIPGYLYALLIGADAKVRLISMLLAAIVAMMGGMALTGSALWPKVRTAVFFPVAIGAGMTVGALLADHTDAMLAVFVLIVFLAVYIRRFGLPFFFYGFMLWIGYFFAALLHPTVGMLPELIGAAAVGAAWVLLLTATVLRTNPTRVLADVRRTFEARAVEMLWSCASLLDAETERARRRAADRIDGRHVRLQETALMIEAWSAEDSALPAGWTASGLRRRTLEWTLALDSLAGCTGTVSHGPAELTTAAASLVRALAAEDRDAVASGAAALRDAARRPDAPGSTIAPGRLRVAALGLAGAAEDLLDLVEDDGPPPADPADDEDPGAFEPAVALAMGNLPGSPSVARDVPPRVRRWNPLGRLSFTSRQAVQVAVACGLAIWIGRELDATRYYWAVIAAFIAFTGTGTRSETFIKSANRVIGTLAGLVIGIWMAHLTAGNTPLMVTVIVLSMFCGLYLVRVGYAYMIFFVTIMVSQLYGILHEFSDHLLMLRLEETIIGAACGIAVALVVAPLSTRDTVERARADLLTTLADLLDAAALAGEGNPRGTRDPAAGPEDDAPRGTPELIIELGDRLRRLQLVAKPLTRPLLWDNSPRTTRHRLTVYGAMVRTARAAVVALPRPPASGAPATPGASGAAEVYRLVAEAARVAAAHPVPLGGGHEPDGALTAAIERTDRRIESLAAQAPGDDVLRPVSLASRLTELLAATGHDGTVRHAAGQGDAAPAATAV